MNQRADNNCQLSTDNRQPPLQSKGIGRQPPLQSNSFYRCCRFLAQLLFKIFCRVELVILESPPAEGPCIMASSHISHFEPALLGAFFPRLLDWVAMEELFRSRFGAWFFEHLHAISADRFGKNVAINRRSLRTVLQRLSLGRAVGIFPEGGIRSGSSSILEEAPMKPGLVSLSLLSQAPIIPCVVLGTDRLYRLKNWLRRPTLWIIIGKAIVPPKPHKSDAKKARSEFEKNLSTAFPALQQELCNRFQLTPEDLPKTAKERNAISCSKASRVVLE
ncbi:MAG: lysophospholipid acyltransferase family protein [Chthoniobacterales bacterium]